MNPFINKVKAIETLFDANFQLYSPKRIEAIMKALGENPEQFGHRFFLQKSIINKWLADESLKTHIELSGPAARLMMLVEAEALTKINMWAYKLRKIIKEKAAELNNRFGGIAG